MNGAAVTHDANGNLTAFGSDTFTWDVRGRLKTLVKGGVTHQFLYELNDLRVKRTVGSTATDYLLAGESVVKEKKGSTVTHLLQSPFTDQPLKRGNRWFIPDQFGSAALPNRACSQSSTRQ